MAYRDRQTPLELLHSAIDWEELRAAYWQDSQLDYAKECRSRAQGHSHSGESHCTALVQPSRSSGALLVNGSGPPD